MTKEDKQPSTAVTVVRSSNRYRGLPVCAATAANIPAAIFFVYETLSRPVSVASSHPQFALVPIFRRVHFYLNIILYCYIVSFSYLATI